MHHCSRLQVHFVKNLFYNTEVLSILKCLKLLFVCLSFDLQVWVCAPHCFLNFIMSDCDIWWHHCWIWWISVRQWCQFFFTWNKFWLNVCLCWLTLILQHTMQVFIQRARSTEASVLFSLLSLGDYSVHLCAILWCLSFIFILICFTFFWALVDLHPGFLEQAVRWQL